MKFIVKLAVAVLVGLIPMSAGAQVLWSETPADFPYYRYDATDQNSSSVLGNSRMKVVTHADGSYQIVSGERCWAKFNADRQNPDMGVNRATVYVGRDAVELVGPNFNTKKYSREIYSGIGFTRYDYKLGSGIKCSRMISVMPSEEANDGNPCFLITVTLTNTSRGTRTVSYEEAFSPEYMPVYDRMLPESERVFTYPILTEIHFRCLKGSFLPRSQKFMQLTFPESRSKYEMAPQSVFLYAENAFLSINLGEFKAAYSDIRLKAGEKKVLNIVVGLTGGNDEKEIAEKALDQAGTGQFGAYELQWKKRLPDFSSERNRTKRRELYMNTYGLESSAVYSGYFEDTFIPAEKSDALHSGENLSTRDHLMMTLPACYTNPDLAKSALRYVMKHTDYEGYMADGNNGYGCAVHSHTGCHDNQIMLFHAVSEYLRITSDYEFLDEWISLYPMNKNEAVRVMQLLERCYIYLRDEIQGEADSVELVHNQSLVSSYFPSFIEQLKASGKASEEFIRELEAYSDSAWEAFRKTDDSMYEHVEEAMADNEKSRVLYNYFKSLE